MKKMVLILTRPFIPTNGGREQMLLQAIGFLPINYNVTILYFPNKDLQINKTFEARVSEKFSCVKKIRTLKLPSLIEIFINIVTRKRSFNEAFFYSRYNNKLILKELLLNEIDVVYCDMIRTAQYIENMDIEKIVDLDDLLSKRYSRFAKVKAKNLNIFGTFSSNINPVLSSFINYFLQPVLMLEAYLIKKREIDIVLKFNRTALVSPLEAQSLNMLTNKKIYALPPARNFIKDQVCRKKSLNGKLKLLFVGNLKTNQNLSSIEMIINKLLPLLVKSNIKFTFNLIGAYDNRVNHLKNNPNICFKGYVDSLSTEYQEHDFLLAPMTFGTGIKLKIIEAIEQGLPVITNSIGAEGLPLIDMENAIISDDLDVLAKRITLMAVNSYDTTNISNNAYQCLKVNFSSDVVKKSFISFLIGNNHD